MVIYNIDYTMHLSKKETDNNRPVSLFEVHRSKGTHAHTQKS